MFRPFYAHFQLEYYNKYIVNVNLGTGTTVINNFVVCIIIIHVYVFIIMFTEEYMCINKPLLFTCALESVI